MEIEKFFLPSKDRLVTDYLKKQTGNLFHYDFQSVESDYERYREIRTRKYPREEISDHIRALMKPYQLTKQTEDSLGKLKQDNSAVVIGGQQAGLATGPLYTIYKMMTIVILAREKEEKLKIPVVPIFWIAGEDHDFQEINHIFVEDKHAMKRLNVNQFRPSDKQMVSNIQLDKEQVKSWFERIIQFYGETDHTKELINFFHDCLKKADTYTEFFLCMSHELFKNYGLLFIDSAHNDLRKIEKPFFEQLINHGEHINQALIDRQERLKDMGYSSLIETTRQNFHLFYEINSERVLLQYDREKRRISAGGQTFSKEDLLQLLKAHPDRFSNNVVTRPIMQEWLFPTLAFVAGPGEIHYWSELKSCFEMMGMKMPPVVPRLNITLLERAVESELEDLDLSLQKLLSAGCGKEKQQTIQKLTDLNLEMEIETARKEIEAQYLHIHSLVQDFDRGLSQIIEKNNRFVLEQLDFLERKIYQSVLDKNQILLRKFDRIENRLYPINGLQERCWNISYFFNQFGLDIVDHLMQLPFEVNGDHYVVKI